MGSKTDEQTTDPIDTQGSNDDTTIGHGQDNPDPQELAASSGSIIRKASFSGMNLIRFMPK